MRILGILISIFVVVAVYETRFKPAANNESRVVTKDTVSVTKDLKGESPAGGMPKKSAAAQPAAVTSAAKDGASKLISSEVREELKRCDLPSDSEIFTLDDLAQALAQQGGKVERRRLEWKNVHFVTHDGEKRRLRVFRDASETGSLKTRLQLFSLDEEGLPVPISIPADEANDAKPEIINKYLDQAQVLETQERESFVFPKGSGLKLSVETKDGRAQSIEYANRSGSFKCMSLQDSESIDCKCLR